MVKRVFGRANGTEISFERKGGDRWEAIVPSNLEGEYIVELYAENDAGNITYFCKSLFVVSGHELHAYVVPQGFSVDAGMADYRGFPTILEYLGKMTRHYYLSDAKKAEYTTVIERGGYVVGRAVCSRNAD